MKKLKLMIVAGFLFGSAKAQTNGSEIAIGTASTIVGAGLITCYFVANKNSQANYLTVDDKVKKQIRSDNAPYLITGIGCGLIGLISFLEASDINIHNKKKTVTAGFMGNGIGMCYTIK